MPNSNLKMSSGRQYTNSPPSDYLALWSVLPKPQNPKACHNQCEPSSEKCDSHLSKAFFYYYYHFLLIVDRMTNTYICMVDGGLFYKRRRHGRKLANMLLKHATSLEGGTFMASGEILIAKVCLHCLSAACIVKAVISGKGVNALRIFEHFRKDKIHSWTGRSLWTALAVERLQHRRAISRDRLQRRLVGTSLGASYICKGTSKL